MMPEHIQSLKKMMHDSQKQPRPILDELQIEEMERLLQQSLMQGTLLEVTTWKSGFFTKKVCQVIKIDVATKSIVLLDEFNSKARIPFFNITSVIEL